LAIQYTLECVYTVNPSTKHTNFSFENVTPSAVYLRRKAMRSICLINIRISYNKTPKHILYPFSVHVITFNFITKLMHLFN